MKKVLALLLLTLSAFAVISCAGAQGERGETGAAGAPGETGPAGSQGEPGRDAVLPFVDFYTMVHSEIASLLNEEEDEIARVIELNVTRAIARNNLLDLSGVYLEIAIEETVLYVLMAMADENEIELEVEIININILVIPETIRANKQIEIYVTRRLVTDYTIMTAVLEIVQLLEDMNGLEVLIESDYLTASLEFGEDGIRHTNDRYAPYEFFIFLEEDEENDEYYGSIWAENEDNGWAQVLDPEIEEFILAILAITFFEIMFLPLFFQIFDFDYTIYEYEVIFTFDELLGPDVESIEIIMSIVDRDGKRGLRLISINAGFIYPEQMEQSMIFNLIDYVYIPQSLLDYRESNV